MYLKRHLLVTALMGLVATTAGAQQVYRIVGPDGKVTFSDQPPPQPSARAAAAPTVPLPGGAAAAAPGDGNLPYTLRQVVQRFPVTIYTSANCGPCGSGKALLASRGVPFTEKIIATNEDISALERMSGAATLPFATIGGQQLKGFSSAEWTQFLDAAGYPKTSQLPSGYRQAAATPLVAAQETTRAAAPAPQATPALPPLPPAEPAAGGDNPTGIRF